jgi:hypothetical protein
MAKSDSSRDWSGIFAQSAAKLNGIFGAGHSYSDGCVGFTTRCSTRTAPVTGGLTDVRPRTGSFTARSLSLQAQSCVWRWLCRLGPAGIFRTSRLSQNRSRLAKAICRSGRAGRMARGVQAPRRPLCRQHAACLLGQSADQIQQGTAPACARDRRSLQLSMQCATRQRTCDPSRPSAKRALNLVKYLHNGDRRRGGHFGYHVYMAQDGSVIQGAPLTKTTNHIKGPGSSMRRPGAPSWMSNSTTIGVSIVGACDPTFARDRERVTVRAKKAAVESREGYTGEIRSACARPSAATARCSAIAGPSRASRSQRSCGTGADREACKCRFFGANRDDGRT